MLNLFGAAEEDRAGIQTSGMQFIRDRAEGDGRRDEYDQVGPGAIRDVARDRDRFRNSNSRKVLAVLAAFAKSRGAFGVVAPKRDRIAALRPKNRKRGPPAARAKDCSRANAHFRVKRCSVPLRRRENFERCRQSTSSMIRIEK